MLMGVRGRNGSDLRMGPRRNEHGRRLSIDTTHDDMTEQKQTPLADESLPPFVAYQVEEKSRERVPSSAGSAGDHYRHGKVEAEARRITDEVTQEAQRRVQEMHEAQALFGAT